MISKAQHLLDGESAEDRACQYLEAQGMVKVARNYRCKLGEIDLIMRQSEQLIFVEVRLRSHPNFASAAESVTHKKQLKLIRAAQQYLQQHKLLDKINCRFDVVTFDQHAKIDWIQNAFGV